jgi:hypothetical protein
MKQKTPEIGAQARAQIAETLPQAIDKAIASYQEFMDDPDSHAAGDFKNHHTACKAALAHIELLLKLAELVNIDADDAVSNLQDLLKNAQNELEGDNE